MLEGRGEIGGRGTIEGLELAMFYDVPYEDFTQVEVRMETSTLAPSRSPFERRSRTTIPSGSKRRFRDPERGELRAPQGAGEADQDWRPIADASKAFGLDRSDDLTEPLVD